MASVNQGGSILSFLLIGGALVALLIGGVYVVQQRTKPSTAAPIATQPDGSNQGKAAAPSADEQNKEAAQEAARKAEAQKEAAKQEVAQKEAPKPAATPAPASPAANELPKTGPTENITALLGMGLLSYMSVLYVRSRSRGVAL